MTTQGRHAPQHDGTGASLLILAAIFAAGALLLVAVLTSWHHAGPVPSGAPGPVMVHQPPTVSQQVTVKPHPGAAELAVWHQHHLNHLAEERKRHAAHVRHLQHLEREAGVT